MAADMDGAALATQGADKAARKLESGSSQGSRLWLLQEGHAPGSDGSHGRRHDV